MMVYGRAPGVSGPHRPYEGSQHDLRTSALDDAHVFIAPTRGRNRCTSTTSIIRGCVSSSPLRGVATIPRPHGRPWRDWSSSPYEGSQRSPQLCAKRSRERPHRPYEGSQLRPHRDALGQVDQSSSPLGGVAAHRPAESLGSSSPLQEVATRGAARRAPRHGVLIAPTRSRNLVRTVSVCAPEPRSHRPCEGSQQVQVAVLGDVFPGPHCPCEGSQHEHDFVACHGEHSSSSPLRGFATRRPARSSPGHCGVLIVPTRGRNLQGMYATFVSSSSSSSLRGVATRQRYGLWWKYGWVSSPLRGVTTDDMSGENMTIRCSHLPLKAVTIAHFGFHCSWSGRSTAAPLLRRDLPPNDMVTSQRERPTPAASTRHPYARGASRCVSPPQMSRRGST